MLRTYTCKYESTYVCMLEEQITFISVIVPHTTVCLPSEVITEIHTKSWYLSYDTEISYTSIMPCTFTRGNINSTADYHYLCDFFNSTIVHIL